VSNYTRSNIKVNLDELKSLYDSLPEERIKIFHNLHYCIKKDVPKEKWIDLGQNETVYAQYFLLYPEDSFTKAHVDNDDIVVKTGITLVEAKDLEGGEILIFEPHYKKEMEVTPEVTNRYKEGSYRPGDPVIPVVVRQEVGETIFYDHNTYHAVSKVLKGTRLVLVTWFKNPQKVLLVGNGTSILDKKLGKEIDSFDTVVRFNSFTTKGYEDYTGSKTDIWFTCMDKHINNMNNFKQVIVHSWFKEDECELYKKLKNYRSDISKIKDINYHDLKAPSTGLIAIDYFLSRNFEVYLHGFDWWDREEHHYADNEERGLYHEPKKEFEIIKQFGDKVKFI